MTCNFESIFPKPTFIVFYIFMGYCNDIYLNDSTVHACIRVTHGIASIVRHLSGPLFFLTIICHKNY